MKKFFSIISVICILAIFAGCGLISESDKSIAKKEAENSIVTINGKAISQEIFNYFFYSAQDDILQGAGVSAASEIGEDFWNNKVDGKTSLETAKEAALETLINNTLQYQKALDEGIKLTATEQSNVDKQVSQINSNPNMVSQLKQMGMDIDAYEEIVTQSAYIQKLVNKYVDEGKIKVSDDDALAELKNTYVKAKHILLMTVDQSTNASLSDEEIAKKEQTAKEVLAKAKSGDDFDALIKQYNEDPGMSSSPDGYVFTTGQMVQEFENAAYALNPGEISDIVKTTYGFHIIKREELNPKGNQEITALDSIKLNLAIPELETLTKKWKSEATIKKNEKVYNAVKPTIVNN